MNARLAAWFRAKHWRPLGFQREVLEVSAGGGSGLVHAPTGVGKTLAAWLPLLDEWLDQEGIGSRLKGAEPLRALWITPLRALAGDTVRALQEPIEALQLPWTVEGRTGDTTGARKAGQRARFPTALVTTPESLTLLLTHAETATAFAGLRTVVVDEWHELLGTKRGVQTELALARLRGWVPSLRTWGLSATLGNLDEAMEALLGCEPGGGPRPGRRVVGLETRRVEVETLVPVSMEKFPWAGHLGLRLMPRVVEAIERAGTTLVFTNVRSQAEIWYRALLAARPAWEGVLGIHHGSLGREERVAVEDGLRNGRLRAVVCTASLDLGVDFSPVDQVIQIGGPKGVARLLQRAGRSGHGPGRVSRVLCVPAHALELVEYAAAREALAQGKVEPRPPLDAPLDVLSQHLVTVALGGGFEPDALFREVRTTRAYRALPREAFDWALDFVMRGGRSLRAYPEFQRVVEVSGRCVVSSALVGRMHRMSVGTIAGDAAITVRFQNGARLGTVEESFVARLKPGQHFVFGGRVLQFIRVHQMTAQVRAARRSSGVVPQWEGGRMPFSSLLAGEVLNLLDGVKRGVTTPSDSSPEMVAVEPILRIQGACSRIPGRGELLVERTVTREGTHWFLYPFAGRLAHEGLAALLAHRLSRRMPITVTVAANDYGLELKSAREVELGVEDWRRLLGVDQLLPDLMECLNATELARRQFREIARVAGLVFPGYPGAGKTPRQVQASSGLFFDVFRQYEPDHLLLDQARREVLDRQLEVSRIRAVLEEAGTRTLVLTQPERLTPLAFPLWAEMIRGEVSSEPWEDRVRRMAADLERELGDGSGAPLHAAR